MKISDYFKNLFQKPTPEQQDVLGRWFEQLNIAGDDVFESEEEERKIRERIKTGIDLHISGQKKKSSFIFHPFLKVAAIFIIILGTAALIFNNKKYGQDTQSIAAQPILPGSRNAIIAFGDGSSLHVTGTGQAAILNQKGIKLTTGAGGKMVCVFEDAVPQNNTITIETPLGSEFQLVLADGTTVWMNAGSSLSFSQNFRSQERRVVATGEVYFEVAKLNSFKFFVQSGSQTVEVLGTQFRVKTDNDNASIKTTLLEGSIKLTNGTATKVLKPGQEASAKRGTNIIEVSNDEEAEKKVSWKDGYFSFSNTDFKTAEEQIEKWYNVEFVYEKVPDYQFYGQISRTASIQDVLKMMELVGSIKFKIDGKKIYVIE